VHHRETAATSIPETEEKGPGRCLLRERKGRRKTRGVALGVGIIEKLVRSPYRPGGTDLRGSRQISGKKMTQPISFRGGREKGGREDPYRKREGLGLGTF